MTGGYIISNESDGIYPNSKINDDKNAIEEEDHIPMDDNWGNIYSSNLTIWIEHNPSTVLPVKLNIKSSVIMVKDVRMMIRCNLHVLP